MDSRIEKLSLIPEDLGDMELAFVRCKSCGSFCSERQPVFWDSKPFAVCSRKPEGRVVIANWKRRTGQGRS